MRFKNISFKAYEDWEVMFEQLSDVQVGKLIKLLFAFSKGEQIHIDEEVLKIPFALCCRDIKIDLEKREHIKKVRREAGKKGGQRSGVTRKLAVTKTSKPSGKFVVPTINQVQAYIQEKNYKVDPEKFHNYYEAAGWTVGKSEKKMKDWKAAVNYWQKQDVNHQSKKKVSMAVSNEEYGSGIQTAKL